MPNNCLICGRIRDRRINSTNWERQTNACALKNTNNKRKKKLNEVQLYFSVVFFHLTTVKFNSGFCSNLIKC
jgi:hypothetical protein